MKHLLYTVAMLLMAVSCSNEDIGQVTESGMAKMQFRLSTTECPVQFTRATPVPGVEKFVICISDSVGKEVKKDTLRNLQLNAPLYLPAGENGIAYTVEAYSNELKDAVLNKPCFYASEEYTVMPDETVTVKLECSLQQFQVSFVPSAAFMSAFRDDETVKEQGGTNFSLTVSDANSRKVTYTYKDLDKSAYFDANKSSSYIKINVVGTTIKGFPVNYTETIEPKDGKLEAKDHLMIELNVSESKSFKLKATRVEL